MSTEELKNITSYWTIDKNDVIADPVKLKSAFEATQTEISRFWEEVNDIKQSGKSAGDQLRAILKNCAGFNPCAGALTRSNVGRVARACASREEIGPYRFGRGHFYALPALL